MSGLSIGGGLSNAGGLIAGGATSFASGLSSSGLTPPTGRARLFGVNLSGAEYGPTAGQTFPAASDWTYLAGLGIKLVRLPLAWESLQTTLGGALDATYLAGIQTALASAAAVGIGVIVDLHNFGAYVAQATWLASTVYAGNAGQVGTGVNFLGDGTLTIARLTDVWTKLTTALLGRAGLAGYVVMNELSPNIVNVNLMQAPNFFSATPYTSQWTSANGSVSSNLGAGTNPLGAAYGPAWQITSGAGSGFFFQGLILSAVPYTLSGYARVAAGTGTGFLENAGTGTPIALTTAWTRFNVTFTPSAGAQPLGIGVAAAGGPIQVANMQLELGGAMTAYVPNPALVYLQAGINALRAVDAVTPIYVSGYSSFSGPGWLAYNYEMAQLTGANLIFDCHQYFDGPQGVGGGGQYSGTWTSYGIDNQSGVQAITNFKTWLAAQGVNGFVGEFGIPNSGADANANWFILQQNFLNYLRSQNLGGFGWSLGANGGQAGNILNFAPAAGVEDLRLIQLVQS